MIGKIQKAVDWFNQNPYSNVVNKKRWIFEDFNSSICSSLTIGLLSSFTLYCISLNSEDEKIGHTDHLKALKNYVFSSRVTVSDETSCFSCTTRINKLFFTDRRSCVVLLVCSDAILFFSLFYCYYYFLL